MDEDGETLFLEVCENGMRVIADREPDIAKSLFGFRGGQGQTPSDPESPASLSPTQSPATGVHAS